MDAVPSPAGDMFQVCPGAVPDGDPPAGESSSPGAAWLLTGPSRPPDLKLTVAGDG